MRLKFCLVLALLVSLGLYAQNETFQFSNLSVKDGLSQNSVIRVFQDSRNYIWFCTRDGLNRYDGTTFKVFRSVLSNKSSISSSDVTSISENKDGTFWIGAHNGLNLFNPQNETFERFFHSETDKNSLSSSTIKFLLTDKSDNTWVATTQGLDLFEKTSKTFKHIYSNDAITWLIQRENGDICFASAKDGFFVYTLKTGRLLNHPLPDNDNIYTLFEDSKHVLWAGMWSSSLKRYNPVTRLFEQVPLRMKNGSSFDQEQIGYMVEYKPGVLMLATRKGVLIYDTQTQMVTQRLSNRPGQLSDSKIITLFKDKSGGIWIGSWNGGIDFYSPYSNYFNANNPNIPGREMIGCVNSIIEANGLMWLATDNGLIAFNRKMNSYTPISLSSVSSSNEVKLLYKDGNDLWISLYTGGLHVFDLRSKRIVRSISNFKYGYVRSMTKDQAGNYWIAAGTNDPFLMLDSKTGTFIKRFPIKGSNKPFMPSNVQDVLLENGQTVWIGTRSDGLYRYNYRTKELKHFEANTTDGALSYNHVSVLFHDSKKNLWIGTFGGGICKFNPKNNSFSSYDHKNGLLNDAVCGIMEDKDGSLWISTLEGISHFDEQKKVFDNYNHSNGYPLQEAVLHSCTKTQDNNFFVGGVNAFVSFSPSEIKKNPFVPNVVISKFKVWTDNVSEDATTTESVYPEKKVKLKYNQAAFTIYFAALNFVFPNKNQYSYMLEGFDRNWNNVINERSATYTNIPPGDYVFRVRACNNDGVWNETGTSFEIEILPPPWKTWWAYLIYTLIFISILGGFIYYILKKQQLETGITIKQMEQRNLEENHQLRVRLFTNFSHELRTPLTLIIGPLNEILAKNDMSEWLKPKLVLIFKNAQRLLWLVNQLMDFRKLESGFMKPNMAQVDFNIFLEDIMTSFRELATTKQITLELKNENTTIDTWFDPILMEKVFFNLLSNAFKHTSSNRKVIVTAKEIDKNEASNYAGADFPGNSALLISVTDDGDGIDAAEIEKVFEPFYQAHNHEGTNIYGTGIGLNLCKGIVELHHGTIWAESVVQVGSTFHILLPIGNAHLSQTELSNTKVMEHDRSVIVDMPLQIPAPVESTQKNESTKKEIFTVLIVEDNEDVRHYVKSLLIKNYRILEAEDCAMGCTKAKEFVPDLIISDIMMPNGSGIELCTELKNNEVTNHIPIILLTALSGLDQIKEGFQSLADDYIVKPFNPELLQVRVENLISIRRRIRDTFRKNSMYGDLKTNLPSTEERFMSKVFEYIKKNIDNPELRIDSFSEDIGMSRVQFYRKIKSITGKTPSSLILEIRMNAASEMLKKTDFNINEIAYQLGFNDSSYFGKCFKAYFGVTPSDYKPEKMSQ